MTLFDMKTLDKTKLSMVDAYIDSFEDKELNLITILHYAQSVFWILAKGIATTYC